jgi:hypothetical protein
VWPAGVVGNMPSDPSRIVAHRKNQMGVIN